MLGGVQGRIVQAHCIDTIMLMGYGAGECKLHRVCSNAVLRCMLYLHCLLLALVVCCADPSVPPWNNSLPICKREVTMTVLHTQSCTWHPAMQSVCVTH